MPVKTLPDEVRRDVVLRFLRGENRDDIAARHGINRRTVYRLANTATERAAAEGAYWDDVRRILRGGADNGREG